jgi:hypothetical protein
VTRARARLSVAVVAAVPIALLMVATWFGVTLPSVHRLGLSVDASGSHGLNLGRSSYEPLSSAYVAGLTGLTFDGASGSPASAGAASTFLPAAYSTAGTSVTLAKATNSTFADAYPIDRLPFTARENTSDVGREQGEPASCQPTGGAVWFRYRPMQDEVVTVSSFGSSYSAYNAVFEGGPRLSDLQLVPGSCGTGAVADIALTKNTNYYLQVTGPLGGGDLVFRMTWTQPPGTTSIASMSNDGRPSFYFSDGASLSSNGRYVAFTSGDPDLATTTDSRLATTMATSCHSNEVQPGRPNLDPAHPTRPQLQPQCLYVYRRDLKTGRTDFVVNAYETSISGNGRYVAFATTGNIMNLPDPCGGHCQHIYVRDMVTGKFTLVDRTPDGGMSSGWSWQPQESGDGRYVAFSSLDINLGQSDPSGFNMGWLFDMRTGKLTLITRNAAGDAQDAGGPRGDDSFPVVYCISRNARYAVVYSPADNLVPHDTNGMTDVFRVDMKTHHVIRVDMPYNARQTKAESLPPSWAPGHCISDDGRFVAFYSQATNLVPGVYNHSDNVYVRDVVAGTTDLADISSSGVPANTDYGNCTLLQLLAAAQQPSPSVPGVGEYQCDTADVDHATAISSDGRYVAFVSLATNLVPGSPGGVENIYRHDRFTGETVLVSAPNAADGPAVPEDSDDVAISADGQRVIFQSWASDLVAGQRTITKQVFVCNYRKATA